MKTKTSWVLAVAGAMMFITAPALGAAANEPDGRGPFADVDGSIHELDVASLHAAGITTGCGEWLFCPDDDVTRAEMAAFLNRALELPPADAAAFSDTSRSRFAEDIAAIAAADITAGCGAGQYCPDEPVTRGQMASLPIELSPPGAKSISSTNRVPRTNSGSESGPASQSGRASMASEVATPDSRRLSTP